MYFLFYTSQFHKVLFTLTVKVTTFVSNDCYLLCVNSTTGLRLTLLNGKKNCDFDR